MVFHSSAW
jgi:DNA-directed RNA polymerase specialized sigma54-like protein